MAAAPPVTVVTATYNWPAALAQAIPTALGQSFGDFEYLVVGDGCSDETEDVVRGFDDPRIVWRNLPENTGNQSGVNRIALEAARGGLIAYLNHDDLWFPEHLALLVRAMRSGEVDLAHSLCLSVSPPPHDHREVVGFPGFRDGKVDRVMAMTSSVMHTAEAARAVGGWIDWRELDEVPTVHFLQRLLRRRRAIRVVRDVTVVKFHSGDRVGCYRSKAANEQAAWAARMRADPQLRYRELLAAYQCLRYGVEPPKVAHPPKPAEAPPGWQIEQWRRIRGLQPMIDLGSSEPGAYTAPDVR